MTGAPAGAFITPRRHVPVVIIAAIAAAWLLAVLAQVTGRSQALHQHAQLEGRLAMVVALAVSRLAWQVMSAAMMLPSSLPLVALFAAVSANGPRPRTAMAALLGGYALVWTGFGALAFLGATAVHHTVMASMWLMMHSWLIVGGVLAM